MDQRALKNSPGGKRDEMVTTKNDESTPQRGQNFEDGEKIVMVGEVLSKLQMTWVH